MTSHRDQPLKKVQSGVIMERRHQCLLDKYCHIYKRIFILGGKSSHNIGLPSCILYVSRHHHKKKDQNCQNKHGVKQMLDWTKKCQNLVMAHARVSSAQVFLKSRDLTVFRSCDNACLSCLQLKNSLGHRLLCKYLQDEQPFFSLSMFSHVTRDYRC